MEEFEKIVLNILSKEQSARAFGEKSIESLLVHSPDQLCISLLKSMESSNAEVPSLCAVLFRRLFIENNSEIPQSCHLQVKSELFRLITAEKPLNFLKKIGDILIKIASQQGFTSEILSQMTIWASSPHPTLKEFALYLFEIATEHSEMVQIIENNSTSVLEIMWSCLQDPSLKVKIAASRTISLILSAVKESENFGQVFNVILDVIQQVPANETVSILTAVSELIDNSPRILMGSIEKIANIMVGIGKVTVNSREVRSASVEVLCTIIKKCKGMVMESQYFLQESLTLSMLMLSEVDNALDVQLWNSYAECEINSADPFSLGKELLCTIADVLQDPIYPEVIMLIDAHIKAPHWLHQHTGIIALGLISEGCAKTMLNSIGELIKTVCCFIYSDNPRLKWAGLTSLGLFCTYMAPDLQNFHYEAVLNSILQSLTPGNMSKSIIQALKCFINFCHGIETDEEAGILSRYTPVLVQTYLNIFTSSTTSIEVLQELLSSLSVLCLAVPDFTEYSEVFLSKLRTIYGCSAYYPVELKDAAIKCIGCIVQATACKETESIFKEMLLLKEQIPDSDICYNTILNVIVKCIAVLKEKSTEYLPGIIEELLKNADCTVEFIMLDSDSNAGSLVKGINIPLRGLGSKKVAISTSALENKKNACSCIHSLLRSLKSFYSPWITQTINIITPLVNFSMNADIRELAYKIVISLVKISTPSQADTIVSSTFPFFSRCVNEKMSTFPEDVNKNIETMVNITKSFNCLTVIGLTGAIQLSEILGNCIREVYSRKAYRTSTLNSITNPSLYSEELELIEEAEELDNSILQNTVDLIGYLLKAFKMQFQSCFTSNFKGLIGELFYKSGATDSELISACCLFCDYIENTGDLLENNSVSPLLQEFINLCYHKNANLRQCAVFGIGLAAMYGNKQLFSASLPPAINACKFILQIPEAMGADLITCTECAVGTIGKIAIFYQAELIDLWLAYLPLKSDPEEAQISHEIFLNNFEMIKPHKNAFQVLSALKNTSQDYLSTQSISVLRSLAN